jgi:2-polyprenyl-6-methoxyphenol hydroxylase-like FAD-dependent oxidoreductase
MRALVVGAGPGGCAAAVALARADVETLVVEVERELRPAGVGLLLQNSPLRALHGLGLAGECVARGYPHPEIDLCGAGGEVRHVLRTPSLVPGLPPAVALSRADLADVLVRAVRGAGAELRLGTTVAALTRHPERVEVSLSDGWTASVDLVVGADGLHSATRSAVLPDAPAPRRTGQLIWRAAAPRPPEVSRYSMLDGGPELGKVGIVPISDSEVYLWMLRADWGRERSAPEDLLPALREQLAPFGGQVPLVSAVLRPEVDLRSLQALLVPLPWSCGRVVLIGDAVHTTTPQVAYGVGMAIEDAVVLADLLGDADGVPEALERFGERRFDRCCRVVEASVQLGEWELAPPDDPSLPGRLVGATLGALEAPP